MDTLEIEELIKQRERIEELVNEHSEKLNEFPALPTGLISEEVRNSDRYTFHKQEYEKNFNCLREFNGKLTSKQKRELSSYKRLKRK